MKKFFEKPFRYAAVFTAVFVLALTYILLDAFVIPKKIADVVPEETVAPPPVETEFPPVVDTEESYTPQSAVVTDTSYSDERFNVKIVLDRKYDTDIYIADVVMKDVKYLKTAFAKDECGIHITELLSSIAERKGAVVAINGDFYGFRNDGFVNRNGTLYRSSSSGYEAMVVTSDGDFEFYLEDYTDAAALTEAGARQIFSFGPVLVRDGEIDVDESATIDREYKEWASNPRTAIGLVEPGHYVFVVSDGRTKESKGLSVFQLAEYMKEFGCTKAYNLDGGGSSELWFNGKVMNKPTGDGKTIGERKVSDIVYVG